MQSFIDDHRDQYGVESICKQLQIAPSTYHLHKTRERDPSLAPPRIQRDAVLRPEVERVWNENRCVYGARKTWKQLKREQWDVARCTVERLMREMGLRGTVRGKTIKTTLPAPAEQCPRDLVNRQFAAEHPNQLWLSDFTYVSTWRGFVYVALVIDAFSRRIVGWRATMRPNTDLVLDALEQAAWARRSKTKAGLIHHSDRGVQYTSIRYTERLAESGMKPSVGSVGDSYDNAMAESIIGLYKTEVINKRRSWKSLEEAEMATLDWVDWYNNRRLMGPIGDIPPAEKELLHWQQHEGQAIAA